MGTRAKSRGRTFGLLGALAVVLLAAPAAHAYTFGSAVANTASSSTSVQPSVGQNITSGQASSVLVAIVVYRATAANVTITSNAAGWTKVTSSPATPAAGLNVAAYYRRNTTAGTAYDSKFNFSASVDATLHNLEFNGADALSPFDVAASATGNAGTATSGSSATGYANEFVVALFSDEDNHGFSTPTNASPSVTFTGSAATALINGSNKLQTDIWYGTTSLKGTMAPTAAEGHGTNNYAGAFLTFHGGVKIFNGLGALSLGQCNLGNWVASDRTTSTTAPGSSDVAIFDNKDTTSCTFTTTTVDELQINSGYTGTVTPAALTVNRDLTVAAGTFLGTATLSGNVNVTGGTLNLNGGTQAFNAVTISSGTLTGGSSLARPTFNSTLTVSGGTLNLAGSTATVAGALTVSSGTLNANAGTFTANGTTSVSGGTLDANGGSVTLNGATTVSSGYLYATKVSGAGSLRVANTLGVSGGTVDAVGGGVTITGAVTSSGGTIQATSNGTVAMQSTLTVNNAAATVDANGGTITVSGATSVSAGNVKATKVSGVGAFTVNNTLAVSVSGTVDAAGGTVTVTNGVTSSGGTIQATSNGAVAMQSTLTVNNAAATVDANGGTITVTGATTISNGSVKATKVSGVGAFNFNGAVTLSGGTYDGAGGNGTFSSATATSIQGGTFKVGAGTQLMSFGLSMSSGTLDLSSDGGQLQIGNDSTTRTLSISGGTLQSTGTAQSTYPLITRGSSSTANVTFTVSAGTLDLNGLRVQRADANGMNVTGTSVTFTNFNNVRFQNNQGGGSSRHLGIARGALGSTVTITTSGCAFDSTATFNVAATATSGGSRTFYLYFDQVNGLGYEGDSHDSDGDGSPDNGVVDVFGTNASLILWSYEHQTDTAGAAVGFPGAAFDWNTFTFYSVYATFSGTAANTDSVYVRSVDGAAVSQYDINTTTYGTIVGTPRWDSVTESTGFDVNGNGTIDATTVHVIYIATSKGYIFKLVDTAGVLALPGSGSVWNTPFPTGAPGGSTTVKTITSPVVSDGVNLYFAGTNSSNAVTLFGVQIASGGTSCNGNTNGRTTQEECAKAYSLGTTPTAITAALAWARFSGDTYVYFASTNTIYRWDVTTNLANAAPFATIGSNAVNGSVRLNGSSLWATDAGGHVYNLYSDPSLGSGSFTNKSGFYYTVTGTPALSTPYYDGSTTSLYFGDSGGKVYKLTNAGALSWTVSTGLGTISTAPLYQSGNGYLVAGDTAGKVAYVDTSTQLLKYTLTLSGSISAISYNAAASSNAGEIMVTTGNGGLYYLPKTLP